MLSKRAAQEVAVEHLLQAAKIVRQNIQSDRDRATHTWITMRTKLEELAGRISKNQGRGMQALRSLTRHFEPTMMAYEACYNRELPLSNRLHMSRGEC